MEGSAKKEKILSNAKLRARDMVLFAKTGNSYECFESCFRKIGKIWMKSDI